MKINDEPKYSVGSVEKMFTIIEILAESRSSLTLSEITMMMGEARSTVHRFIKTMEALDYLVQHPSTKRYSLSYKFLWLGYTSSSRDGLINKIAPVMNLFAMKYEVFVTLYLRDGINMYAAHTVSPASDRQLRTLVTGNRILPYASAAGKLSLALAAPEVLERYLQNITLTPLTSHTIIRKKDLRSALEKVRVQGYSTSFFESNEDDCAMAFPIYDQFGQFFSAVSLIAKKDKFEEINTPSIVGRIIADLANLRF
ncbi:MAG: IclR family transcriptional regulator [Clostridiales Family XIII bacterium]|nr:IclR family transcriptional regulator [Clostridiales Family XIII bacterium]